VSRTQKGRTEEKRAPVPLELVRRLGKLIKVKYGELVNAMFHKKIRAAVKKAFMLTERNTRVRDMVFTTTHYTCS